MLVRPLRQLIPLVLLFLPSAALAAANWTEAGWPLRRPVDVQWDPKKQGGDELALADFYMAGAHPSESVRVVAEDGRRVPARVLMLGPGDRMKVLFAPARGVKRHYVYFGHPNPPPIPPGLAEFPVRGGLVLEMRRHAGELARNTKELEAAWVKSAAVIGRALVPSLHMGYNPFSDDVRVMSRFSGTFVAPVDGEYTFAGGASDCGQLYIDAKPLLWVPGASGDVRYNAKVDLKRGRHDIAFLLQNIGGEQRLSVAWKRPDGERYELIPGEAFGQAPAVTVGELDSPILRVLADAKVEYVGECFYFDHYSHRYRFTVQGPRLEARIPVKVEWSFGDGQTATGPAVDHVFLDDGVYPVTLTVMQGQTKDQRTFRIAVSRMWERITNPPGDLPSAQAKIVAGYDVATMPAAWVPWAARLFERSKEKEPLEKSALRLARIRSEVSEPVAAAALAGAAGELADQGAFDSAARVWEAALDNPLHAKRAAIGYAELLLWRMGEPARALKVIEPQAKKQDAAAQRLFAQAMVLSQRGDDGAKAIAALPAGGAADKHAALAGAMSRTIEYFIKEGELEAGEREWDRWFQQYPGDFMEGYSVLLRTRLMEAAKAPEGAARIAEAFALAVPRSSYAPMLLDRASRLWAQKDPAKSKALRDLLRKNYPEDPLSQDPK